MKDVRILGDMEFVHYRLGVFTRCRPDFRKWWCVRTGTEDWYSADILRTRWRGQFFVVLYGRLLWTVLNGKIAWKWSVCSGFERKDGACVCVDVCLKKGIHFK